MTRLTERRHLGYSVEQLFDLVADVETYPEFLPSIAAAHVRRREGDRLWLDLVVGTGAIRRRFSSMAVLERPHRIEIASDDPLFERYAQRWTFTPDPTGGAIVEFQVDFAFRSRLLQLVMGALLQDAARRTVRAFERRARRIHGAPSGLGGNPVRSDPD